MWTSADPSRSSLRCAVASVACYCAWLLLSRFVEPARADDIVATTKFSSGQVRPATLAVLPLHLDMALQKVRKLELLVADPRALDYVATRDVATELERRGYVVTALSRAGRRRCGARR